MGVNQPFLTKVDLKNGYHSMEVEEKAQRYSGFRSQGQCYKYVRLPKGVTNGVYYFRLFVNALIRMLPPVSQRSVKVYIDDFVIGHPNMDTCEIITQQLLQVLAAHNVKVDEEKSVLLQTTTMELLVFNIDNGNITLPNRRKNKLVSALRRVFDATHITKRNRQQILGLVEAAQVGMTDVDLIREQALINEVIQSIPEDNAFSPSAIFQEEHDAYVSALEKLDRRPVFPTEPTREVKDPEEAQAVENLYYIIVYTHAAEQHFGLFLQWGELTHSETGQIPTHTWTRPAAEREMNTF